MNVYLCISFSHNLPILLCLHRDCVVIDTLVCSKPKTSAHSILTVGNWNLCEELDDNTNREIQSKLYQDRKRRLNPPVVPGRGWTMGRGVCRSTIGLFTFGRGLLITKLNSTNWNPFKRKSKLLQWYFSFIPPHTIVTLSLRSHSQTNISRSGKPTLMPVSVGFNKKCRAFPVNFGIKLVVYSSPCKSKLLVGMSAEVLLSCLFCMPVSYFQWR
jgi:hypothetical protein